MIENILTAVMFFCSSSLKFYLRQSDIRGLLNIRPLLVVALLISFKIGLSHVTTTTTTTVLYENILNGPRNCLIGRELSDIFHTELFSALIHYMHVDVNYSSKTLSFCVTYGLSIIINRISGLLPTFIPT